MYQPKAQWVEEGDSYFLLWGHVKVGEVTQGGNGTWYAYYTTATHGARSQSLRDFIAPDLAQRAVEEALAKAAEGV